MHKILLLSAFSLALSSFASAQTFVNGSLTGSVDDGSSGNFPSGWRIVNSTPDTTDINTPTTFLNNGNPEDGWNTTSVLTPVQSSQDGGTWVSAMGSGYLTSTERFGQTVSGFTIGKTYTISWEQSNYGVSFSGVHNLFFSKWGVTIDGGVGTLYGEAIQPTTDWTKTSISFQATQETHDFIFSRLSAKTSGGQNSYASIDGIALSAASVPEASSSALLGLAGISLLLRRKR